MITEMFAPHTTAPLPFGGSRTWRRVVATVLFAAAALPIVMSSPATAQTKRRSVLLHEQLPSKARGVRADGVVRSGDGNVEAIETASGRIEKPERPPKDAPQAPLYESPKLDRATVGSDRKTGGEGTLHYRAVFNPTVAPFKRDRAFDRVTADGQMEQSGDGLKRIEPHEKAEKTGRELFWGHVTVELIKGRRTPIPSVAPDAELVHYEALPRRKLAFYRDAAGNFSVTAERPGSVTLRYLLAAPSTYFGAPIGAGAVADDPAHPTLAPHVQRKMAQLWPALGVAPNQTRKTNVEKLVEHFRGFEPGQLESAPGGDLLVDLIVARKGVCRHRSHAFVAMAHSLGIPAHYVINDAHAFVEVWVVGVTGRGRWQRIDLGGGADTLRLHGANDKHLHDPLFRDALPRPQSYNEAVTNVSADGRLNDSGWAGAGKVVGANGLVGRGVQRPPDALLQSGDGTRHADSKQPGTQATANGKPAATPAQTSEWLRQRAADRAKIARNVAAPESPPSRETQPPSAQQIGTRIQVTQAAPTAWVGEKLRIVGKLSRADGKDAGALAVEVWLVTPRKPTEGQRLGTAVTIAGGTFATEVAIPMTARLGEHDVVVHFPGRGKLAPSYSRD